MKINQQPTEPKSKGDGETLDIIEVFSTIQGEGPYAGMPATFIRLAGCSILCPLCDTNYTEGRHTVPVTDIVSRCHKLKNQLIVLTGGEPLRQNIRKLVRLLHDQMMPYKVQIETNGTLMQHISNDFAKTTFEDRQWYTDLERCTVVCCPKTPGVNKDLEGYIDAWKYVVAHDQVAVRDGLPTSSLGMPHPPARPSDWFMFHRKELIYIQPLDEGDEEKNKLHLQQAIQVVRKFGYRLCLQQHKLLNLP